MTNPAETYEREMVPVLFEPWAAALLDHARLTGGERILDIACGTGIVARRAVRRVAPRGRVSGVDLNPNMLAVARMAAEREGVTVTWREGNAEALPFGDAEFDLVLCQQGLQFVPERPRAVAEMHRVLGAGGRVALALWRGLEMHPLFAAMNEVIQRHFGRPVLAMPFSLGEPDEIRALLDRAGFRDIELEQRSMTARFPNPDRYAAMQVDVIAAAVPDAQQLDDAARANLLATIKDEMASVVREATHDNHVVIPMHAVLVRASRG